MAPPSTNLLFSRPSIHRNWMIAIIALSIGVILITYIIVAAASSLSPIQTDLQTKKNIVVIVTDDQRADTLRYMPKVQKLLVDKGVTFENAFATTPLCCPARASFMSGGFYPHQTHVLNNGGLNGGAIFFEDKRALPVILQGNGYVTGMIGKYMNGYDMLKPKNYIPPGWNNFVEATAGNYTDYDVVRGNSTFDGFATGFRERGETKYNTDFLKDEAIDFINANTGQPFFLYLAFYAPHAPSTPALEDLHAFDGFTLDTPARNESDLSDKPLWVQEKYARDGMSVKDLDYQAELQIESLQSVDRAIWEIINELQELDLLRNTVVFYTSDNGITYGEHGGLNGKTLPYEESIRVPLVMIGSDIPSKRTIDSIVAWNLDIPATIYKIADITDAPTEGMDLMMLIKDDDVSWRDKLVIQGYDKPLWSDKFLDWIGLRTSEWKYVEYDNGEKELYNLIDDPYELENLANDLANARIIELFDIVLKADIGLAITKQPTLEKATVGESYNAKLTAWGGKAPYSWIITEGELPAGLKLNSLTGEITGVPAIKGTATFTVTLTDNSISSYDHRPQRFARTFTLVVR